MSELKRQQLAQNPAFLTLVEALAERLVADYLTEQTASGRETLVGRPNHVQLPKVDQAA